MYWNKIDINLKHTASYTVIQISTVPTDQKCAEERTGLRCLHIQAHYLMYRELALIILYFTYFIFPMKYFIFYVY